MISKIIKRDGTEVDFDSEKIFNVISKANTEVDEGEQINRNNISAVTNSIIDILGKFSRAVEVEEIQ